MQRTKVKIRERERVTKNNHFNQECKTFSPKKKNPHTREEGNDPDKQKPHLLPTKQSLQSLKLYSQNKQTNKRKIDKTKKQKTKKITKTWP